MTAAITTPTRTDFSFSIDPADFAAVAGWVARRIPAKPKDPLLAGVLLTLRDGTSLTIEAFDYDVSTRAEMEVMGEGEGQVLISGRLLAELVQTFPAKRPLTIRWNGGMVALSCGGWNGTMPTMPVEDYPALPNIPAAIGTVDAKAFGELIDQVSAAVSKDETKPDLTGVHATFTDSGIKLVAIDGYRAGQGRCEWTPLERADDAAEDPTALVPGQALSDAGKMFASSDDEITIGLDGNLIAFVGETVTITMRLIGAEFKGAKGDIGKFASDTPATVDVDELSRALKRANLMRDEKAPVSIQMADGDLAVVVHETGDRDASKEHIPCKYAGEAVTFAVNPAYLLDGLGTIHGLTVEISVTHPTKKPVLLSQPGSTNGFLHMVSPVRRFAVPKS